MKKFRFRSELCGWPCLSNGWNLSLCYEAPQIVIWVTACLGNFELTQT